MRKKQITAIVVLCAVVVVLFGAYFVADMLIAEREERTALSSAPVQLFDFDGDTAFKMQIDNDEGSFTFEFIDSTWQMTEGGDFAINSYVISTILNYMSSLETIATITKEPSDLAAYGFDNPVTISCFVEDSSVYTLMVGDPTPTGDAFYVKLTNSDTVYTIEYSYGGIFCASKDTLKNLYILDCYMTQVDSFYLERGGEVIWDLTKPEDGVWSISQPLVSDTMPANISVFLNSVVRATVTSFVTENPEDLSIYGLDTPSHRLKLHAVDDNGKELSADILFGDMTLDRDDATDIYGMFVDTGQVFTIAKSDVGCLDANTEEVLLPYIHYESVEDLEEIRLESDAVSSVLKLDYENEQYMLDDIDIDALGDTVVAAFRNFYTSITQMSMYEVDAGAIPSGEAAVTITYTRKEDPKTVVIELIPATDNTYYVVEDGIYLGYTVRHRAFEVTSGFISRYEQLMSEINKVQ